MLALLALATFVILTDLHAIIKGNILAVALAVIAVVLGAILSTPKMKPIITYFNSRSPRHLFGKKPSLWLAVLLILFGFLIAFTGPKILPDTAVAADVLAIVTIGLVLTGGMLIALRMPRISDILRIRRD